MGGATVVSIRLTTKMIDSALKLRNVSLLLPQFFSIIFTLLTVLTNMYCGVIALPV